MSSTNTKVDPPVGWDPENPLEGLYPVDPTTLTRGTVYAVQHPDTVPGKLTWWKVTTWPSENRYSPRASFYVPSVALFEEAPEPVVEVTVEWPYVGIDVEWPYVGIDDAYYLRAVASSDVPYFWRIVDPDGDTRFVIDGEEDLHNFVDFALSIRNRSWDMDPD
jgi:hypothetical protein